MNEKVDVDVSEQKIIITGISSNQLEISFAALGMINGLVARATKAAEDSCA